MQFRNRKYSTPRSRGFTIIELFVVALVIGLMLALILPGVLGALDKARRAQCANNLRQYTVALTHYHDLYDSFPPAWLCDRRDATEPQWGWNALLLPIMEQGLLYESIQPGPNSLSDLLSQGVGVAQPLATELSTAVCPADRLDPSEVATPFWQGAALPAGWRPGRSNYVAGIGYFCRSADYENNGVMYGNSAIPVQAIGDGASCTMLLGERDRQGGPATWVGIADPQDPGVDGFARVGGVVSVPMNCPIVKGYRDRGFSSQHPGGSQFAFCDGSVRFLGEHIDFCNGSADRWRSTSDELLTKSQKTELGVYQCLGVRNDNRPISRLP